MTLFSFGHLYVGKDTFYAKDLYFCKENGTLTWCHGYYRVELGCPLALIANGPTPKKRKR